jgi:hypothetical protein
LLPHLGLGSVTGRELMTGGQRFNGLPLREQSVRDLGRRLSSRIVQVQGMAGECERLEGLPIRLLHLGPLGDCGTTCFDQAGVQLDILAPWPTRLTSCQSRCGAGQLLLGVLQPLPDRERIRLDQIMNTGKEVRHTQALTPYFG